MFSDTPSSVPECLLPVEASTKPRSNECSWPCIITATWSIEPVLSPLFSVVSFASPKTTTIIRARMRAGFPRQKPNPSSWAEPAPNTIRCWYKRGSTRWEDFPPALCSNWRMDERYEPCPPCAAPKPSQHHARSSWENKEAGCRTTRSSSTWRKSDVPCACSERFSPESGYIGNLSIFHDNFGLPRNSGHRSRPLGAQESCHRVRCSDDLLGNPNAIVNSLRARWREPLAQTRQASYERASFHPETNHEQSL